MYTEWQKTKTTRLYVHPPKSERFYTLWREGKLVFSEVTQPVTDYGKQTGGAIWFVDDEGKAFDFHKNEFFVREDGIPLHQLKGRLRHRLYFSIETFALPHRKGACVLKLTVKNPSEMEVSSKLGFFLRSGAEGALIYQAPDLYASYATDLSAFKALAPSWREVSGGYTDGTRFLRSQSDFPFSFDEATGEATAEVRLAPGAKVEALFVCDYGAMPEALSYEDGRDATLSFWEKELARLSSLPTVLSEDRETFTLIKSLTAQMLQCFCYPVGSDLLLARQGGLQRQVWAFESISVLEALSRTGDFDDYVEPIIDSYFGEFYNESGEITPLSISWAMITANALSSFARYAARRDKGYFSRYRDKALASFRWIKATRAFTSSDPNLISGLFPPKSSCDDPFVFQSWCNTDTFNLRGIKALSETFALYGDPAAKEIEEEYHDYLALMRSVWKKYADKETSDKLSVPFSPTLPDELVSEKFLFSPMTGYMVEGIDMDERDALRVLRYYTESGMIKDGFYDRMPNHKSVGSAKCNLDEDGNCLVWYVCCHEYYWFLYFLRHGMRDKCEEILRTALRFAFTEDGYMIERYHQRDPWFAPWSPNASACGRVVCMLLDLNG